MGWQKLSELGEGQGMTQRASPVTRTKRAALNYPLVLSRKQPDRCCKDKASPSAKANPSPGCCGPVTRREVTPLGSGVESPLGTQRQHRRAVPLPAAAREASWLLHQAQTPANLLGDSGGGTKPTCCSGVLHMLGVHPLSPQPGLQWEMVELLRRGLQRLRWLHRRPP